MIFLKNRFTKHFPDEGDASGGGAGAPPPPKAPEPVISDEFEANEALAYQSGFEAGWCKGFEHGVKTQKDIYEQLKPKKKGFLFNE